MIIYNVTIQIDAEIEPAWLQWIQQTHIPEVMATGCFTHYKLLRLLDHEADAYGRTYAVQYMCLTMSDYERYLNEYAAELRNRSLAAWGNRFAAFRTVLEEIK